MDEPLLGADALRRLSAGATAAGPRLRRLLQGDVQRFGQLIASLENAPAVMTADPWRVASSALGDGATAAASEARQRTRPSAKRAPAPMPKRSTPPAAAVVKGAPRSLADPLIGRDAAGRDDGADAMTNADAGNKGSSRPIVGSAKEAAPVVGTLVDAVATSLLPGELLRRLMDAIPAFGGQPSEAAAGALMLDSLTGPDTDRSVGGVRDPNADSASDAPEALTPPSTFTSGSALRALLQQSNPLISGVVAHVVTEPAANMLSQLLDALPLSGASGRTQPRETPALAARAPSRLLDGVALPAASASPSTPKPAAPRGGMVNVAPSADQAAAQALNRLLVDQAWLRGVDLS